MSTVKKLTKEQANRKIGAKLSTAMRRALKDLIMTERSKKYKINMNKFHGPIIDYTGSEERETGVCRVCFAGALMAGTLQTPQNLDVNPDDFGKYASEKLHALDIIRCGSLHGALESFGVSLDKMEKLDIPEYVRVASYSYDGPKEFKKDIRKVIKLLESKGL